MDEDERERWRVYSIRERERERERERGREGEGGRRTCKFSVAGSSTGYVRLAGRAVGQQLPKWSGKQYPCAGVKSDGGSSDSNTGCASGDSLSFVHPSRNERGGGGGDGDGGGSGGDSGGGVLCTYPSIWRKLAHTGEDRETFARVYLYYLAVSFSLSLSLSLALVHSGSSVKARRGQRGAL
ncbi:hypothetical protein HZH68_001963 [Vespula germanica]|uniref:Uncharacterized protein n=1 Tax=Vespula germanica TaxID=30212 RepID=A0A834KYI9_VESGE|nr:hypothetical protein HZH68_001963 [Vespula germanica]